MIKKGEHIQFGGYNWRVLDVKSDRALLLSDSIFEERALTR